MRARKGACEGERLKRVGESEGKKKGVGERGVVNTWKQANRSRGNDKLAGLNRPKLERRARGKEEFCRLGEKKQILGSSLQTVLYWKESGEHLLHRGDGRNRLRPKAEKRVRMNRRGLSVSHSLYF